LYGSDRVALESVSALVEQGWHVTVALSGEGPLVPVLEGTGADVVIVDVPVLRKSLMSPTGVVRFAVENVRRGVPMRRLLARLRPDLVYVSTVTVPAWLPLARSVGAKVLVHVHEAEESLPRPVRLGLAAPLLLAHGVVANSEVSRQIVVRDLPALSARTRVVYNGVPGPATVSPSRDELTDPVRLVLVGRVSPRKGTDVAVEALGLLRARGTDARLTLVGGVFPGYEWFEEQVRARVAELGLADHVEWTGVLPDVWKALDAADVALVPSRVEPFGNAAVEAMLARRPVVAGNTQGLREIVTPGVNGELAEPGDAVSLAEAVLRVVDDWPGAVGRAAKAEQAALARFAPSRYREEIAAEASALVTGLEAGRTTGVGVMTASTQAGSPRETYAQTLHRLRSAQKPPAKGSPAYSRFVNRKIGRFLAAGAYQLGLTPNHVTFISAAFSAAALALIALVRPTPLIAVGVTLALLVGYAFDSADGQLARLRGGGSPAGEWLDHVVDAFKTSALHLSVLIGWYRFYRVDERLLLVPVGFALIGAVFFFVQILTDQLRRAHPGQAPAAADSSTAAVVRSLIVLPTDYGLLCGVFLALAWQGVFVVLYGLLFAGTTLFVMAALPKWYREVARFRR